MPCAGSAQASPHGALLTDSLVSSQKFTDSAHRNLSKPMTSDKSHARTFPPNHREAQTRCSRANRRTYLEATAA